jgi:hypothetical protein
MGGLYLKHMSLLFFSLSIICLLLFFFFFGLLSGGVAHGPRGPKSFFFMEKFSQRVLGLRIALTVKFHQAKFVYAIDDKITLFLTV